MRSLTVAPAKPTWRVASMLARRRYLGCCDELHSAVSSLKGGSFPLDWVRPRISTDRDGRRRLCRAASRPAALSRAMCGACSSSMIALILDGIRTMFARQRLAAGASGTRQDRAAGAPASCIPDKTPSVEIAAHVMATHSNGMSARQLEDQLGVTYRPASLLTQKLRRSMIDPDRDLLEGVVRGGSDGNSVPRRRAGESHRRAPSSTRKAHASPFRSVMTKSPSAIPAQRRARNAHFRAATQLHPLPNVYLD
jgi:hypothetical protein